MKTLFLAFTLLLGIAQLCRAQEIPPASPGPFNRNGRVSLALNGGANLWMSDFPDRKISGAGDFTLRYAVSRHLSIGLIAGYDALQTGNTSSIKPTHPALQHSYIVDKGFSGDFVGWYHFSVGQMFSPYVYLGLGTFSYKRKVEGDKPWPDSKEVQTLHIPVGIGIESALSHHLALNFSVGARIVDNKSDNWIGTDDGGKNLLGTDWYPAARLGLNVFFGSSVDDDDDADGLLNGFEKKIGTLPDKTDSDGDGLSDADEYLKHRTDPTRADSDGDGLSDGDEMLTFHTDPIKADTDGDGIKDGEEVNTTKTDPLKADTDGDGLNDYAEIHLYKTSPLKPDSDGDGLSDGDEVNNYKTNPLKPDTDGGSVDDGVETARGSNPLDRTDDIVKKEEIKVEAGKAMVLDGIVFDAGKSIIKPNAEKVLGLAYNTLAQNPGITVEIRGYTDNVGKKASNIALSEARAKAVREWLINKGIAADRVSARGFGPANPIGNNAKASGRQANRRIEFYRVK
jgi:outer membrane protein OmpA-like peptidoglycan-associated protein